MKKFDVALTSAIQPSLDIVHVRIPEHSTKPVIAIRRPVLLAELARLLHRHRSLDPEKRSRDLCVRVQRLHERGVILIEHAKLESIRS
jgi:hypothetical protein